jgi:16S rRNA (guanine(966)-N(2))-methyltransferase RsmD
VREALFSRLQSRYDLEGGDVLDLFAGTGALGLEALSRGAHSVVSVEFNRRAARVLLANLQACGAAGRGEVIVRDVVGTLPSLARQGRRFAGVFVDPPYRSGLAQRSIAEIALVEIVVDGGWVSVECAVDENLPEREGRLVRVHEHVYGDTKLALYERVASGG